MGVVSESVGGSIRPGSSRLLAWLCLTAAASSLLFSASFLMQIVCLGLGAGCALVILVRFTKPVGKSPRHYRPWRVLVPLAAGGAALGFPLRYLVILGISTPVTYGDYMEPSGSNAFLQWIAPWIAEHATPVWAISALLILASTLLLVFSTTFGRRAAPHVNSVQS